MSDFYIPSMMADAAYVPFDSSDIDPSKEISKDSATIRKFGKRGWTESQFEEFQQSYLVRDYIDNESFGLAVTLFEHKQSGQLTLAFRGTEPIQGNGFPLADLFTDLALAVGLSEPYRALTHEPQLADFLERNGIVDSNGDSNPALNSKLNVVGHSLGGHLSAMFALDHPELIQDVTTFNAAGISLLDKLYNDVKDLFRSDSARAAREALEGKVTNVYAEPGIEVTASRLFFDYLGSDAPVFIERPNLDFDTHSMVFLVDALSVRRILETFDGTVAPEHMDLILRRSVDREYELSDSQTGKPELGDPNKSALSLNTLMAHMATILGGTFQSYTVTNQAAEFYKELSQSATQFVMYNYSDFVDVLETASSDSSAAGRALRYSLIEGLPFVLFPATPYSDGIFSSSPRNSVYDAGLYSDLFWADRVDYVQRTLTVNEFDLDASGTVGAKSGGDATHFIESFSTADVDVNGHPQRANYVRGAESVYTNRSQEQHVLFGTQTSDVSALTGRDHLNGDRIYGLSGDDVLEGKKGNDFLEGGRGNDTYVFQAGDGHDSISDDSGLNRIHIDGSQISSVNLVAKDTGISESNGALFVQSEPGELVVISPSTLQSPELGSMHIEGFDRTQNNFGLSFVDAVKQLPPKTLPNALTVGTGEYQTSSGGILSIHSTSESRAKGSLDLYNLIESQGLVLDISQLQTSLLYQGVMYSRANLPTWMTNQDGEHLLHLSFEGSSRSDDLLGSADGEYLFGGEGSDYIRGLAGFDMLEGSDGADWIEGGSGSDYIWGNVQSKYQGSFKLSDKQTGGVLVTGYKDERAEELAGFNDRLFGGAGNDRVSGDEGNDLIAGDEGNDLLFGGEGNDTMLGGVGEDTIYGDSRFEYSPSGYALRRQFKADANDMRADIIDAGAENDHVYGEWGSDVIFGGEGSDTLWGDAHNEDLSGEHHGNDALVGGLGNDTLIGGGGSDALFGGSGEDVLHGDGVIVGNDTIVSLSDQYHGSDTLRGGDGDDALIGGGGQDYLYGDEGNDQLFGDGQTKTKNIKVDGINITKFEGPDTVATSAHGEDLLLGGEGDDFLSGGGGSDTLLGGAGSDHLYGQDGNDILTGGAGNDTLVGGKGNDHYVLDGLQYDFIYDESGFNRADLIGFKSHELFLIESSNGQWLLQSEHNAHVLAVMAGETHKHLRLVLSNDSQEWVKLTDLRQRADHTNSGVARTYASGARDDIFIAGAGDDTFALGGDASGSDIAQGGVGADVYYYSAGDGETVIRESASDFTSRDQLILGAGFSAQTLGFSHTPSGAIFTSDRSTGSLVLDEGLDSVESISFANGDNLLFEVSGGNQTLQGSLNDDFVYLATQQNTLDLGAGDDRVIALEDSIATYRYALGDGDDTVELSEGSMFVELAQGIRKEHLSLSESQDGLRLQIASDPENSVPGSGGVAGSITIKSNGLGPRIDSLAGVIVDGVYLTPEQVSSMHDGPRKPFSPSNVPLALPVILGDSLHVDVPLDMLITGDGKSEAPNQVSWTAKLVGGSDLPPWLNFNARQMRFELDGSAPQFRAISVEISAENSIGSASRVLTLEVPSQGELVRETSGLKRVLLRANAAQSYDSAQSGEYVVADGEGFSVLNGNLGNDTLYGSYSGASIRGGAGDDTILARGGGNEISDGAGNDRILVQGSDTEARISIGSGHDSLRIDEGAHVIELTPGFEKLTVKQAEGVNTIVFRGAFNQNAMQLARSKSGRYDVLRFSDSNDFVEFDLYESSVVFIHEGNSTHYGTDDLKALFDVGVSTADQTSSGEPVSVQPEAQAPTTIPVYDIAFQPSHDGLSLPYQEADYLPVPLTNVWREDDRDYASMRILGAEELKNLLGIDAGATFHAHSLELHGRSENMDLQPDVLVTNNSLSVMLRSPDYVGARWYNLHYTENGVDRAAPIKLDVEHENTAPRVSGDARGYVVNDDYLSTPEITFSVKEWAGDSSQADLFIRDVNSNDTLVIVSANNAVNGAVQWDEQSQTAKFIPDWSYLNGSHSALATPQAPSEKWHYDFGFDLVLSDGQGQIAQHIPVSVSYSQQDVLQLHSDHVIVSDIAQGGLKRIEVGQLLSNDITERVAGIKLTDVAAAYGGRVEYDRFNQQVYFMPDSDFFGSAGFWYQATDGYSTKYAWVDLVSSGNSDSGSQGSGSNGNPSVGEVPQDGTSDQGNGQNSDNPSDTDGSIPVDSSPAPAPAPAPAKH